jgi:hypothetical protein
MLSLVLVSLLVGCTDMAPEESSSVSSIVTANRITLNRITLNRITLNRLQTAKIAEARLSSRRLKINMAMAQDLLATEDGRDVFSVIVGCAVPGTITLVGTVAGTDFEFPGELGLAPQWLDAPLDPSGQRWVSACIFSKVNAHDVALPISVRGPSSALTVTQDERQAFPLEEGAFFGNLFVPLSQPIQWFACRGKDQARGETGGLIDRDCTEPDPAHPGLTQCGFFFAGDCGDFAVKHSCEAFFEFGTFYLGCHTKPFTWFPGFPGLDNQVFFEVITTFVTP